MLLKENDPYRLLHFVKVNMRMKSNSAVCEEGHVGKLKMCTKQQLGFLPLFIDALGILCSFVFHGCLINKNTVHGLHDWGVIHRTVVIP